MADGPYPLDFLQTIINVHFGGNYLAITAVGDTPDSGLHSFAVIAGFGSGGGENPVLFFNYSDPFDGSAGSISMTGPPRVIPPLAIQTLIASDFGKTITTRFGTKIKGFALSQLGVLNNFATGTWFLDLSSFPGGTLQIAINNAGESPEYISRLGSYKQGVLHAGVNFNAVIPVDTRTLPPANFYTLSLDTNTLKFSGP
jgi:hypothetical protein